MRQLEFKCEKKSRDLLMASVFRPRGLFRGSAISQPPAPPAHAYHTLLCLPSAFVGSPSRK